MYAMGATPEGYSPWFISHNNYTQTEGGDWENIIDGNFIYEKWRKVKQGLWNDKTTRVVFVKRDGKYYFYGLYKVKDIEQQENFEYIKTYERIRNNYRDL